MILKFSFYIGMQPSLLCWMSLQCEYLGDHSRFETGSLAKWLFLGTYLLICGYERWTWFSDTDWILNTELMRFFVVVMWLGLIWLKAEELKVVCHSCEVFSSGCLRERWMDIALLCKSGLNLLLLCLGPLELSPEQRTNLWAYKCILWESELQCSKYEWFTYRHFFRCLFFKMYVCPQGHITFLLFVLFLNWISDIQESLEKWESI